MQHPEMALRATAGPWLGLVAAIVLQACAGSLGGASAAPQPSVQPTPTAGRSDGPTQGSSPTPTIEPTTAPSGPPADGPLEVDLDNVTANAVTARIVDETATLVGASSGQPGDRMSVRWYDAIVENIDARTLRLVWAGLPLDGDVDLRISGNDADLRVRILQALPPDYSDALGYDRILVLAFDHPIKAESVTVTIERGAAG